MSYRHLDYMGSENTVLLPIHLPLELAPLAEMLKTAKLCLCNNFISSFITLVGAIIAFHYESIMDIQDECPLILCYSSSSGTGMYLHAC